MAHAAGTGIRQDDQFKVRRHEEYRWSAWRRSITAAQLLQRFVGKTPWAHLDIAGTGNGFTPNRDQQELGLRIWGALTQRARRRAVRKMTVRRRRGVASRMRTADISMTEMVFYHLAPVARARSPAVAGKVHGTRLARPGAGRLRRNGSTRSMLTYGHFERTASFRTAPGAKRRRASNRSFSRFTVTIQMLPRCASSSTERRCRPISPATSGSC